MSLICLYEEGEFDHILLNDLFLPSLLTLFSLLLFWFRCIPRTSVYSSVFPLDHRTGFKDFICFLVPKAPFLLLISPKQCVIRQRHLFLDFASLAIALT